MDDNRAVIRCLRATGVIGHGGIGAEFSCRNGWQ
jgi:hypothetical protein